MITSEAGNVVLAQFHSTSTFREIERLARTGVPLAAALTAARGPARMLLLEHKVGTIEVGKRSSCAGHRPQVGELRPSGRSHRKWRGLAGMGGLSTAAGPADHVEDGPFFGSSALLRGLRLDIREGLALARR